jgi:hypothetical protein
LTFPQLSEDKNSNGDEQQSKRLPLSGIIEEMRKDIQRIKEIGIEHIMFASVGLEVDELIDTAKQLGIHSKQKAQTENRVTFQLIL